METFPLALSVPSILLSACHLDSGLSICSLLLQKEVSLKTAPVHEWRRTTPGVILLLPSFSTIVVIGFLLGPQAI